MLVSGRTMTFLCSARFIPYLYDVRVPNNVPDSSIAGWVRVTRKSLDEFSEYIPWLSAFGYEEWIQCCVNFDAAYNVVARCDPELYQIFMDKQKNRQNIADKMSQVVGQPIDLQEIQTVTLGVLPHVNGRMRLFQD